MSSQRYESMMKSSPRDFAMRCLSLLLAAFVLLSAPTAAGVHSRTSSASPQIRSAAREAACRVGLGPAARAREGDTVETRTQRR